MRDATMPRFFFHIRTPDRQLLKDDQGVELADLNAAVQEAADAARSFAADVRFGEHDYSGCYFEIRSASGSANVPAHLIDQVEGV